MRNLSNRDVNVRARNIARDRSTRATAACARDAGVNASHTARSEHILLRAADAGAVVLSRSAVTALLPQRTQRNAEKTAEEAWDQSRRVHGRRCVDYYNARRDWSHASALRCLCVLCVL